MYNINLGKNCGLLDSCDPLKGYSTFIDRVRSNIRVMPDEEGVDEAVRYCIDRNILKDVLEEERSGVMLEMLTEVVSDKEYKAWLREEAREEARERIEKRLKHEGWEEVKDESVKISV